MPVTKPFLGRVVVWKKSGVAAGGGAYMAVDDKLVIPTMKVIARNPLNKGYPSAVNASAYPSLTVAGKKTPSITIAASVKPSFVTRAFLNSLLLSFDSTYNNSDEFLIGFYDGSAINYGLATTGLGWRLYQGCRCASVSLSQSAVGGPIGITMTFLAVTGDNENSTTYTAATAGNAATLAAVTPAPDPGALSDVSNVDFGASATIDGVRSWQLNLNRGQGHQFFVDGSYYPDTVESGMFSGSFTCELTPLWTVMPSDTNGAITVRCGKVTGMPIFSLSVHRDETVQDMDISLGNQMRAYTLANTSSGGNPCVITAS